MAACWTSVTEFNCNDSLWLHIGLLSLNSLVMHSRAVVATDDNKIAECCRGFGADVIMTSESCRNGISHALPLSFFGLSKNVSA